MVKQLVLGTILGAIVLFVWSALAWMIIPWPGEPFRTFTNEQAVMDAIKANAPQSGNYLLPNEPKRTPGMTDAQYKAAEQAAMDQSARGPMIFAVVRLGPMGMVKPLVIQFVTDIILALLACILLLQTDRLSYFARVAFVTGIGVLIFIGGHVEEWNWFSFSTAYLMMELGAIVIGWILAGLWMAKFVRGKTAV
ncbi:MAG TPA: hypothetical protein VIF81_02525 [Pyrinomonadaceae bacterium]|jgi:hypothetical protein